MGDTCNGIKGTMDGGAGKTTIKRMQKSGLTVFFHSQHGFKDDFLAAQVFLGR